MGFMNRTPLDVGELGHELADVLTLGIEAPTLSIRVENPKVRRGIGID